MNKNFILILVFLVLLYIFYRFDFFRYLQLHFDDENKYISSYRNKKRFGNQKVVVSLTTTPMRIHKIKPVIKSLLDQTVRVDDIVINIPKKFNCNVPDEVNNMCSIYKCGKDYGPGTKIITTVLRETDQNVILILVNDDYIYGRTFIEDILLKHYNKPDCALVSKEAILVKPDFFDKDIIYTTKKYINDDWIKNYINTNMDEIKNMNNIKSFLI